MYLSNAALASAETYTPGLPSDYVARTYGVPIDEVAKLGSAENPFGPSPLAVAAVREAIARLEIYPEWTARALREKLAATFDLEPERFVCGAGETEIIPWLVRAFAEPGGRIQMHAPTFPIYHMSAEAEGRRPVFVPMGADFAPEIDRYIEAIEPDTRILFLTNPHSPSGRWMEEGDVRRVCEAAGERLVVLDEAYVHFSETPGYLHLVREYPNLLVMRTFSKVYGLAGLRAGFAVGAPERIRALLAIKPTWNLGQVQIAGAAAALDDHEHVARTVAMVREERAFVAAGFEHLDGFRMVPDPRSNFFLIEILDPALDSTKVFDALLERGVIVKDGTVSFHGLGARYLRSDVSLRRHMERLLRALGEIRAA